MRMLTKVFLVALAAILMAGGSDAAFAARKKHHAVHHRTVVSDYDQRKRGFDRDLGLQYDADGTPIIMKGFGTPAKRRPPPSAAPDEEQPKLRADRPRPRGSST